MKNYLLTALWLLCVTPLFATVSGIEAEVHATTEFGTTYRVYITFDANDDELVAIYGTVGENQNAPLTISSSTSFFQSEFGGDLGENINPAFVAMFPEIAADSWLTIGTEDTNGSGGVSSVGMEAYWDGFNNGSGFTVDTFTGASWFIIPGSSTDAISGDDQRVLIAQLTTDGILDLVVNVQYDDANGTTSNLDGLTLVYPELPAGCMDESACNYDATAEINDGSCVNPGDACDDGDAGTMNDAYSDDCVCAGDVIVEGCTDSNACNYEATANVNVGCINPGDACDDEDNATAGDVYTADCNCEGQLILYGCTDSMACNYNAEADENDGSCEFPGDACDDGLNNTVDDAYTSNCDCEGELLPTGPAGIEVEEYATSEYGTTYRVYATFDAPTNELIAVYGTVGENQNAPLTVETTTSFYQTALGSNWGEGINPAFVAMFPEIGSDSWFTIGTEDSNGTGGVSSVGLDSYLTDFNNGNSFTVDTFTGASWYIVPGSSADAIAGDDMRVLVAQLTTDGILHLVMNFQYDDANSETYNTDGLEITFPELQGGCTDMNACNYDDTAEINDGSCLNPGDACDDGDAGTINDVYSDDCVCAGEVIVEGCTDSTACNYDGTANVEDDSCAYLDECGVCGGSGIASGTCDCDGTLPNTGYDCNDQCLNDADNDGVCDEFETAGCTDVTACNYSTSATDDDGSCASFDECGVCGGGGIAAGTCDCDGNLPETGYDCEGVCLSDTDGDGVCDDLETPGCTDEMACNYDQSATDEDGSCVYPEELLNCDGSCANDENNNNICDELEVFGCMAETADNYDSEALTDNGSCVWLDGLVQGLEYEVFAEDGIDGMTTYRVYAVFASDDIEVTAMYGTEASPWQVTPSTSFYQDAVGGPTAAGINPLFFAGFPSLEFDSWVTLGAAPGVDDSSGSVGMDAFFPSFEAGGALNVNTFLGGSLYLIPGSSDQAVPVEGKVLVAQITTDGTTDMLVNLQIRDEADESVEITGLPLTFPMAETPGLGCTDASASNYDPAATLDDGTCDYPEPSYSGLSYELISENMPEAGMRTFRVYANFDNPQDQMTAVFAQAGNAIDISSSSSFYQNALGGTFASEINPAAVLIDPDVAYDSWMTIGGEDNSVSLSTVGTDDAAQVFAAGGNFQVDNDLGASWFVLPDLEPAAFPDENGQVLLAQLTTTGEVTFQVSIQYRAQNGDNPQALDQLLVFPDLNFGCTDSAACNYDEEAEAESGECTYAEDYLDCEGACLNDADNDGVCDELEIPGCTNDDADNYDASATDDDGSCEFLGCTDEAACNYDATANTNDGSCDFPVQYYDCNGDCMSDIDNDGICDELEIPGCTDDDAPNYNADATDDDGTCEYPGCTNPNAENYDPSANVDDGSCIAGGCLYPNASNYDAGASFEDGSCTFSGCTDEMASNYCPLALVDDESCVFDVMGCTYEEAPNYNADATMDDGSCEMPSGESDCPFDTDGNGMVGSADLLEFLAAYSYPCQ